MEQYCDVIKAIVNILTIIHTIRWSFFLSAVGATVRLK
jgi:hypothetical protein